MERRTIHIKDVLADPEYTYGVTQVDPVRTVLAIPMLKVDELLGVIVIYRHEVRPFTGSQITLNNDSTLTSAILDRVLHHVDTILIEGKSFRAKAEIAD